MFALWQHNLRLEPVELVFKPAGTVRPNELNLFQGLTVRPRKGGSYVHFKEHLSRVAAENGDRDGFLWKLFAYRMQNLGRLVPCLLVLIGREGGGKSTITRVMARLLEPYDISLSDPEKFVGRNNASLQGKLFVQLEEMILGRKEEYDSRLKHYITSDRLDVEEKYKAQWQIENHLFVAMTANKLSAVRVTEHSRRFSIYEVVDQFKGDQKQREEYFGQMWAELEDGGLEALAYDLTHEDIAGFSPAAVPKTKLFLELVGVDADRDPLRGWWKDVLESGISSQSAAKVGDWSEPILKDSLYLHYQAWCERNGPRARAAIVSKAEWAKQLGRMLPGDSSAKRIMIDGQRSWYFVLPSYEACCDHFERQFGVTLERAIQPGQLRAVL